MDAGDRTDASPARSRLAAAAIVGVGAVLPVVVTALGGGFGITRNDDWAYLATMRTLVEHGVFRLGGPAEMTLAGQIYLAWPVAALTSTSTTALQLTTVAVGTAGLFAVAALARTVLDLTRAAFVALAVAVTPLWPSLVTTFMTDVWAFAFGAVALLLVVRAVDTGSTRRFLLGVAAALAAAAVAVTIRQTAVVALFAVIASTTVGLLRIRAGRPERTTERWTALVLVGATVLGCAWFYRWRSAMPLGDLRPDDIGSRGAALLGSLDVIGITCALLLLPASVAFLRRDLVLERIRALPRAAPLLGIALAWLVVWKLILLPIDRLTLYDYAGRFGPSSYSGPEDKVAIVPWFPWALLIVAAAANLWALVVVLSGPGLRRCWRTQPVLATAAATMVLGTVAMFAASWLGSPSRFDRYLLPAVPYAALLLAWVCALPAASATGNEPAAVGPAPGLVIGRGRAAGLVVLVALSAWFGLASASFDRAVHRAGEVALRQVGPSLDAGWTVTGTWSTERPPGQPVPRSPTDCWTLRQAADRSDVVGEVVAHDRLLWVDRWFSVVNERPGCGADADLLGGGSAGPGGGGRGVSA
ncbi:MAG: glycosyltransferase family 39 protein, partial [Aquihabitans sp.]